MSQRPTSRPSQLTGKTPVRPPTSPELPVEPSAAPEPTTPAPTTSAATNKVEKTKVGFYMTDADLLRAQRAHTTTIIHTGQRSWTAYVNEAVMSYTKQLEQEHNDSKPF